MMAAMAAVCASRAPANRHVRRASSSASPAVNWSGVTWSPWSAASRTAGVGQGAGDGVGVERGHGASPLPV